jgi:multiple sugar transport system permease protein
VNAGGPARDGSGSRTAAPRRAIASLGALRSDSSARWLFIWPAVLVVMFLSIFPLVASVTLSVTHLVFSRGRIDADLVGLTNYTTLLFGTERNHFLGVLKTPTPVGWLLLALGVGGTLRGLLGSMRHRPPSLGGLILRLAATALVAAFLWLVVSTLFSEGGRPGALVVTFIYVFAGTTAQFLIGLGLAVLAVQQLVGRRFFRVVFLIPLTITPVGVGYMFKMMTDTGKGPFEPVWAALGLTQFTWVTDPWAARVAVMIGDAWQWIPFMFIVLLAALEGQDQEVQEASLVDGASRWQTFRHISIPAIVPVSTTIVLIRMIESFKIIDMPNILTGGGPGTATQSLTLESYLDWRTLNLGRSAAIAYLLLVIVTVTATMYLGFVRRRATVTA